MSTPMLCQARTASGAPCVRIAHHSHITQSGTSVLVCGSHLRVLKKRERLGSDEEQLQSWGVVPVPTPSPGQTTPLGDVSPPLPVDG